MGLFIVSVAPAAGLKLNHAPKERAEVSPGPCHAHFLADHCPAAAARRARTCSGVSPPNRDLKPWPQFRFTPMAFPAALRPLPISRTAAMPAESDGGVKAAENRWNVEAPPVSRDARGLTGGAAGEAVGAVLAPVLLKSPFRGLFESLDATGAGEVGGVITCARSACPFNAKSCESGMLARGEGDCAVVGLVVGVPQGDCMPTLGGEERSREPASGLAKSNLFK